MPRLGADDYNDPTRAGVGGIKVRPSAMALFKAMRARTGGKVNPNEGRPGGLNPYMKSLSPTPYMGIPSQRKGGFKINPTVPTRPGFLGGVSSILGNLSKPLANSRTAPASTARTAPAPAPIMPTSTAAFSEPTGPVGPMESAPMSTEPVTPPSYETDATYQAQVAELMKALADYQAQSNLSRSQYDANYNEGLRTLGWNQGQGRFDRENLRGLYGQAQASNTNDFGARGLLRSGLFAQSMGDIDSSFNDRKSDLDRGRQDYLDSQSLALSNFMSQNQLAQEAARREALARLAAQYGV